MACNALGQQRAEAAEATAQPSELSMQALSCLELTAERQRALCVLVALIDCSAKALETAEHHQHNHSFKVSKGEAQQRCFASCERRDCWGRHHRLSQRAQEQLVDMLKASPGEPQHH